jgi:membrane associated rhomboid family serine protease
MFVIEDRPAMTDSTPRPDVVRRREPLFNVPGVIVVVCGILLAIHALREIVSIETDNQIVAWFAFLPARITLALHVLPNQVTNAYHATVDRDPVMAAQIDFLIGDGHARWWTFLTYAFLHGSWAHVGFNCVWLVAFGSAVARRFTAGRFLLLLVVAAVAGAIVQFLWDMTSFQIVLGASAAVAGAMGAATRFIFRPTDEPARIFDRTQINEAFRQPALSLRQIATTKPALVFVVLWFLTNLLFGYVPALGGIGSGPIAWQAHIGGFLAGLLLFPLLDTAMPEQAAPDVVEREATIGLTEDEIERSNGV